MKKIMAIVAVMVGSQISQASLFTDNFDRANTSNSQDGSTIGTNYVSSGANGTAAAWKINSNQLAPMVSGIGSESGVLSYQNPAYALSGSFTVSADVTTGGTMGSSVVSGLALNYKDQDNFYALAFGINLSGTGQVYLYKFNNAGTTKTTVGTSALTSAGAVSISSSYLLTATSTAAGVFNYTLATADGSTTLLSGTFTDSSSPITGGYAGLYALAGASSTFDNFSVSVIPEPATVGLFSISMLTVLVARRLRR